VANGTGKYKMALITVKCKLDPQHFGKTFGIDKNSTVGSVVERVTREMEKDKNISKRVKSLKDLLRKS